jgi:ammonia channel protein AmtB
MLTGVFATPGIAGFNRRGDEIHGLLTGNLEQLKVQAAALGSSAILAVAGTLLIAALLRLVAKRRVQGDKAAQSA